MSKNSKWFAVVVFILWYLAAIGTVRADWLERQKLLASDGADGDWFGRSVSISGDYAIVGASCDDDKGDDSGSAYIFRWEETSWVQQQKLTAFDGAEGDRFGESVSISSDYAIVGAYCDDDNGSESGSAYIFKRDGTDWLKHAKLLAADGAANDYFGYSVSISGDYAIVGAYHDDDNGENSGSAYIFERDGANWIYKKKLTASDGAVEDFFGVSVSISGSYAIVGAYGDDYNGLYSGSSYIFYRHLKYIPPNFVWVWEEQAKLLAADGAEGDRFGESVSISGDYVIVGAYGYDSRGNASGTAYIFKREGSAWLQQPKLLAADGNDGDYFGWSVSISGDYAIVGAYGDDDMGIISGSAYIFKSDGLAWLQQPKLLAADGAENDRFGESVSISGDYAIVGSYRDDDKGINSGSAYVFMRCPIADLSGDCFVDFVDFADFAAQWLQGY